MADDPRALLVRLDEAERALKSAPLGGAFWDGGAETFINKGTNGRWRDVLTAEDIARYEVTAEGELGAECARWLASGTRAADCATARIDGLASARLGG